ncbi:uncharacterized protein LOC144469304 [Augochlora pura]
MAIPNIVKWLWSKRLPEKKSHKRYLSLFYAFLTWNVVLVGYYQACAGKNYVTTEGQKTTIMERHKTDAQIRDVVVQGLRVVKNVTHKEEVNEQANEKVDETKK